MLYLKRGMRILLFLAVLIVLLLGLSQVFRPKNNMEEFGMEEVRANGILGEKEQTIDILVVGDSESYTSISPLQIWRDAGYTAYVCGTAAQKLDYSYLMIKRAFQNQSPKLVILETNAVYRDVKKSKIVTSELEDIFCVFRYHNRWKDLKWNDLSGSIEYTRTEDLKGFSHNDTVKPSEIKDYMQETEAVAEISPTNIHYVKAIKKLCDEHGAKMLLLRTPSTMNWNYAMHNGIKKLAEEIGCEQVDLNLMNDKLKIDWDQDTHDRGDHLNSYGATKVTGYLTEYLKETGRFRDHRQDAQYSKWHESLQRFQSVIGISRS